MKTTFHFFSAATLLLSVLLTAGVNPARADVIHVTNGISRAAGDSDEAKDEANVLEWDVDSNGTIDFYFSLYAITNVLDMNPPDLSYPDGNGTGAMIGIGETLKILNLPSEFEIGSSLPSGLSYIGSRGDFITVLLDGGTSGFSANTPGYIGFSFKGTDDSTLYGWARFTIDIVDVDTVPGMTISEWAYENSGASIFVPVPEPGSTGVCLSAVAFGAFRRWRRRARAARS